MRSDGRKRDQPRPLKLQRSYLKHVPGSVLIETGDTKVLCTAMVEERVPPFLRNKKKGWVTAEYGMLPASTKDRIMREAARGKISGRTQEIQRLIGRSLRSVIDASALGERTIVVDCDVIQADGGTRTASITGAYIAVVDALRFIQKEGRIEKLPVRDYLAAISVGKVAGKLLLDLNYVEDSSAEVDMNVVMTGSGQYIEVQGTAEREPFTKEEMDGLMALAGKGIKKWIAAQKALIGEIQAVR